MFRFKKFFAGITATVICACLMSGTAFAYSATGTVNVSSTLNVRQYSNTGSPIIGKLYSGAKVSIVDSSNGWYKISYNNSTAWVAGQYLKVSETKAQTVVNTAESQLGAKYVFAGATPSGFDCSGLTLYCYNKTGISLFHSSAQQATQGVWVSRANLAPGDLVFFDTDGGNNNINHVGIYVGNGNVIQAESGVGKVAEINLSNSFWSGAYMTTRRIIN